MRDDLDFTSNRVSWSPFAFYFSHVFDRGRNFSTLIYLFHADLSLPPALRSISDRIFSRRPIQRGKYDRGAKFVPRSGAHSRKGLRVFPLSEAAIADITVAGILVGPRS